MRGGQAEEVNSKAENSLYIFGSSIGFNVKADSKLAEELHHNMIAKATNLQGLLCAPDDF